MQNVVPEETRRPLFDGSSLGPYTRGEGRGRSPVASGTIYRAPSVQLSIFRQLMIVSNVVNYTYNLERSCPLGTDPAEVRCLTPPEIDSFYMDIQNFIILPPPKQILQFSTKRKHYDSKYHIVLEENKRISNRDSPSFQSKIGRSYPEVVGLGCTTKSITHAKKQ
ncbi:hypothetical protein Trydic_g2567 [Trypoxylus dichotomus]